MCYYKFHTCKTCGNYYECNLKDVACPTLNRDADRNLCLMCRKALEIKLEELSDD